MKFIHFRFSIRTCLLTVVGLGISATAPSLRAEFIMPIAVEVSSDTQLDKDNLINGLGWVNDTNPPVGSPYSVHNGDISQMWFTMGSSKQFLTFDLGKMVNLTKVYIWSFNALAEVSVKDAEVWVSSETDPATATNFNAIASMTLLSGTNNPAGDTNAQTFDVIGTGVRLVRIKSFSNWGNGFLVGLAEARFGSGAVTGSMPWVALNSPHEGDEFGYPVRSTGADITIDATVTDPDGPSDIQMVQVFDGPTLAATLTNAPYTVVLHGVTNGTHTIRAKATDKSGIVAWNEANIVVRQLYADRVIKIDDALDEGTNVNQIAYYGISWVGYDGGPTDPRYNHGDHASGTADDYYEVRFRGVKIDVFTTVASHHGYGYASIDGIDITNNPISFKAPGRSEQVWVYGSPILTNGVHVFRVNVSTNGVVTADRFDVQVYDLVATQIAKVDSTVNIDLNTPIPDGQYQVYESTDFSSWNLVPAAVVTKTGDHTIRASVTNTSSTKAFYRVVLVQ